MAQRVVGYYPDWMRNEFPPIYLDMDVLTHVIHAFAWPDVNGNIISYDNMLNISNSGIIHKKFLLSLGGWGQDEGFAVVSASSELRHTFINNLLDVCDEYEYDGVDIDWEFPQSVYDRNNLNLLVSEMDSMFHDHDSTLLITMAVPTSSWSGQWFDFGYLKNHIDFFNAMTYNMHGTWSSHAGHNSPLYQSPPGDPDGSCQTGINYLLLTRGVPADQINLGLPFWGIQFNASNINGSFTGSTEDIRYSEIPAMINNGWTYHWDSIAYCPYLISEDQSKLVTYDNPESIAYKCEYTMERGLGGVMIWALGYDVTTNGQELIQSIGENYLRIEMDQEDLVPSQLSLKSYPNPFNQSCKIVVDLVDNELITINIYDILGNRVDQITNETLYAGQNTFYWNAHGRTSGVYFIKLQNSHSIQTQKIMFIK
tara:strand:+ start:127 stop:1401 length:1275 start_codon:yes stop_codon:yes gene_type:complete